MYRRLIASSRAGGHVGTRRGDARRPGDKTKSRDENKDGGAGSPAGRPVIEALPPASRGSYTLSCVRVLVFPTAMCAAAVAHACQPSERLLNTHGEATALLGVRISSGTLSSS